MIAFFVPGWPMLRRNIPGCCQTMPHERGTWFQAACVETQVSTSTESKGSRRALGPEYPMLFAQCCGEPSRWAVLTRH